MEKSTTELNYETSYFLKEPGKKHGRLIWLLAFSKSKNTLKVKPNTFLLASPPSNLMKAPKTL
jgi:hypothetical protein